MLLHVYTVEIVFKGGDCFYYYEENKDLLQVLLMLLLPGLCTLLCFFCFLLFGLILEASRSDSDPRGNPVGLSLRKPESKNFFFYSNIHNKNSTLTLP